MSQIDFKLRGVEDIKIALRQLGEESATKVGVTALREAAKTVRDEFVRAAPVGTEPTRKTRRNKRRESVAYDYGHLRDNIRIKKRRADGRKIRFSVGIGDAFWGAFLEFGTRHQRARPWLRPAFDRVAGRVVDDLGKNFMTGLKREVGRLKRTSKKLGLS